MGVEDTTLTYETLFEFLRKEKKNEDIQELDPEVFAQMVNYLNDKLKILKIKKNNSTDAEVDKTRTQIQNVRRIIKELIERRQSKIINLAVNRSSTQSDSIKTDSLLKQEQVLYDDLVKVLDRYRKQVLLNIINAKMPSNGKEKKEEPKKELILVRFVHYVPKFMGEQGEIYGPFEPEDMARLPRRIAKVLINGKRAEEMTTSE